MRIKRFEAPDSKTALAMVKEELGDDAVILANRTIRNGTGPLQKYGKSYVEVVAAMDYDLYKLAGADDLAEATEMADERRIIKNRRPQDKAAQEHADELAIQWKKKNMLNSDDTGSISKRPMDLHDGSVRQQQSAPVVNKPTSQPQRRQNHFQSGSNHPGRKRVAETAPSPPRKGKTRKEEIVRWRDELISRIQYNPFNFSYRDELPRIVALVGATGVGKTTTAAKLAAWAALHEGKDVALVSMDCYRIGATDQLRTYGKIMHIPCDISLRRRDLKGSLERYQNKDLIIIDTAGKNPYDEMHVQELADWFSVNPNVEPYLAISATTKKEDLTAVIDCYKPLAVHGLVLTKLDETRAYASLCQQVVAANLPVSCLCTGQKVPEDFLLASDEALGHLFRSGWQSFVSAFGGRGGIRQWSAGLQWS